MSANRHFDLQGLRVIAVPAGTQIRPYSPNGDAPAVTVDDKTAVTDHGKLWVTPTVYAALCAVLGEKVRMADA